MTAFAEEQAAEAAAPAGTDSSSPPQVPEGPGTELPADTAAADDPLADLKTKARLSDSLQREIKRLHGVLKATKEQNQRLRAGFSTRDSALESRGPEPDAGEAGATDEEEPAASEEEQTEVEPSAVEPDEEGLVEFAGMRVTPELAERLMRAEQLTDRFEEMEGELGRRDEEELLSEIAGLADAYETNAERAVIELRRQIIPLEGEAEEVADEVLLALVNQDLARATREDGLTVFDLTPEKIHELGLKAVNRLHKVFGIFGAKQLQSNQQYRETHRAVRPGGSPAVQPPKGWKQMTPAEREEFLARSAAAVLRRGSGE